MYNESIQEDIKIYENNIEHDCLLSDESTKLLGQDIASYHKGSNEKSRSLAADKFIRDKKIQAQKKLNRIRCKLICFVSTVTASGVGILVFAAAIMCDVPNFLVKSEVPLLISIPIATVIFIAALAAMFISAIFGAYKFQKSTIEFRQKIATLEKGSYSESI